MTPTQLTAEQLRLARECAERVLGGRITALIGKDYKGRISAIKGRIAAIRAHNGDKLPEVQSAIFAIQATEARMADAVEAERERCAKVVENTCYNPPTGREQEVWNEAVDFAAAALRALAKEDS